MIGRKLFFPLSYHNNDIYYIELDSIKNENEFIEKLCEVNELVNEINSCEYIILHIEESNVTKKVFDEIIIFINTYKIKMKRLGIVGAHGFLSLKLRKQLKNINDLDYYFCNDYQKAKDIIIGLIKKANNCFNLIIPFVTLFAVAPLQKSRQYTRFRLSKC